MSPDCAASAEPVSIVVTRTADMKRANGVFVVIYIGSLRSLSRTRPCVLVCSSSDAQRNGLGEPER